MSLFDLQMKTYDYNFLDKYWPSCLIILAIVDFESKSVNSLLWTRQQWRQSGTHNIVNWLTDKNIQKHIILQVQWTMVYLPKRYLRPNSNCKITSAIQLGQKCEQCTDIIPGISLRVEILHTAVDNHSINVYIITVGHDAIDKLNLNTFHWYTPEIHGKNIR